jgi:hypothetical protein
VLPEIVEKMIIVIGSLFFLLLPGIISVAIILGAREVLKLLANLIWGDVEVSSANKYELDPLVVLKQTGDVIDAYVPLVDKDSMEDKVILAHEEDSYGLSPWEVQEVVQDAMRNLPDGLEGHVDILFDIIYEAVADALERVRS